MPIGRYVPLWTKIVNGVSLVSSQASCLAAFQKVITHTLYRTFGTLPEVLLLVADRAWSLTSIHNGGLRSSRIAESEATMDSSKWQPSIRIALFTGMFCAMQLHAEERKIDPTFLYRGTSAVQAEKSDLTTSTCHYKPLFGKGDSDTSVAVSVARYGEAAIDPNGECATVQYPEEDQVYVVIEGKGAAKYGNEVVPLNTEDYLYLPSTTPHTLVNNSGSPMVVVVMGFHTRGFEKTELPPHPFKANVEDVPTGLVSGHPDSTLYRLLMGDVDSKRDRLAAGHVLTSLFVMEIAPGGTNFPHHHQREEEIYLVLSGHGDMVAGGGIDGIEGRHPAKAGDAYFFRLNCTVGYYSAPNVKSRILAVRSWYPGMQQKGAKH
jgi:mannose-6-phosphate isomerase-like protein (cupin superfamily)